MSDWVAGKAPRRARRRALSVPARGDILSAQNVPAYCYLLGLYLGDGDITEMGPRSIRLRISLDSRYPVIVESTAAAIALVLGVDRARIYRHPSANLVVVTCYALAWRPLFPQHGLGPKHARDVSLEAWQRRLTNDNPGALVRGLLHSDGSRFTARQRTGPRVYEYPRYCFANRSGCIIAMLCDHLDVLGIAWTMPRPDLVQIARRDAVCRLDSIVGPKR